MYFRPSILRSSIMSLRSGSTFTVTSGVVMTNCFLSIMFTGGRAASVPKCASNASENACTRSADTPH